MFRKAFCFALVAITSLLSWEAPAWAAKAKDSGGDPKKIGSNLFNIFSPNAKSLWKFGLLAALLYVLLARPKGSLIVATFISIVVSGAIIWNPDGMANMVNSIGQKIL
jgi:hypothetical protein